MPTPIYNLSYFVWGMWGCVVGDYNILALYVGGIFGWRRKGGAGDMPPTYIVRGVICEDKILILL